MSEYESEPIRGLPGHLPSGEAILWQGAPTWRGVARRVLHIRGIGLYFAALAAWRIGIALTENEALTGAVAGVARIAALAGAACALITLLAWAIARTTVYTLTNKRIVLRFGVALPMAINLPLSRIAAADIARFDGACGDIVLQTSSRAGLGYLQLWPHVRPWKLASPQPMLRAVPEIDMVAALLAKALQAEMPISRRVVAADLVTPGFAAPAHGVTA